MAIPSTDLKCSCGKVNKVKCRNTAYSGQSDDESDLSKVLNGTFNMFKCEKCGNLLKIEIPITIQCNKGEFEVSPKDDPEKVRELFIQHGLIDENGKLIHEFPDHLLRWTERDEKTLERSAKLYEMEKNEPEKYEQYVKEQEKQLEDFKKSFIEGLRAAFDKDKNTK